MATQAATASLTPGTIVKYHGSIQAEHWPTWIITDIAEDGRYTLQDRDYPQSVLQQVRRASITPTGTTIALCPCGHDAALLMRDETDVCGVCGWECRHHIAGERG